MLRVLGTIAHSQYAKQMKNEQKDLISWVNEIHGGMYPHLVRHRYHHPRPAELTPCNHTTQRSSGLFGNYADNNATFDDASSTTLLASTVYRLALLGGVHKWLPVAEQSRQALWAPSSSATSNNGSSLQHFTADMWLTPVVNPENIGLQGSQSPEGQAFVLDLDAAWRDWVSAGSPGANGAGHLIVSRSVVVLLAVLTGAALW